MKKRICAVVAVVCAIVMLMNICLMNGVSRDIVNATTLEPAQAQAAVAALDDRIDAQADFYDYYYDRQIIGPVGGPTDGDTTYTQGAIGGAQNGGRPYTVWNGLISSLNETYPLYLGTFWLADATNPKNSSYGDTWGNYTSASATGHFPLYSNFYWAPNISQRGPNNVYDSNYSSMVTQGLAENINNVYFSDSLVTGNYSGLVMQALKIGSDTLPNQSGDAANGQSNWNGNWIGGEKHIALAGYTTNILVKAANNRNCLYVSYTKNTGSDAGKTKIKVRFDGWTTLPAKENLSITDSNAESYTGFEKSGSEYILDITNSSAKFTNNIKIGDKTSVSNFPFYLSKETDGSGNVTSYKYEFDSESADHVVYVDKATGVLSDKTTDSTLTAVKNGSASTYGFYPFNKGTTAQANLNYGFGTKFTIGFDISDDGKDLLGNDQIFQFSGDDDVWVYIDDKLVLDMGGDHAKASGEINFATGAYIINKDKAENNRAMNIATATNKYSVKGDQGTTGLHSGNLSDVLGSDWKNKEHTMTVYYMERGMLDSNLKISFNFTPIPNENTLEVKEITDFTGVNKGLLAQTKKVADKDVFNYTIQNAGTDGTKVQAGYKFPTYENIQRVNTEAAGSPTTTLASSSGIEKTVTYNDYYLYLKPDVWDSTGNPIYAAYFYGATSSNTTGKSNVTIQMEKYTGATGIYQVKIPTNSQGTPLYSCVIFLRCNPVNTIQFGTADNPFDTGGVWNQTDDLKDAGTRCGTTNILYTITDWNKSGNWGTTTYPSSRVGTETVTDYPTFGELFKPNGTGFTALNNVAFKLTDFVDSADEKVLTGITDANGQFNLLYNETAKFKSQFTKDSVMSVEQAARLYTKGSGILGNEIDSILNLPTTYHKLPFAESAARYVGTYYTTTVTAIDKAGYTLPEYESNTSATNYTYKNTDAVDQNETVQLTQIFKNTVNSGSLVIEKTINSGESYDTDKEFTFHVTLDNLFGSSGDDKETVTDYSKTTYWKGSKDTSVKPTDATESITTLTTVGNAGEVKLKAGEKVVISGIPVGTTYTVTEQEDDNYKTNSGTARGTIQKDNLDEDGYIISAGGGTVTVDNTRKTGTLALKKSLADSENNPITSGEDYSNTEFTFNVTLTVTDFDISYWKDNTLKVKNNGTEVPITWSGDSKTITAAITVKASDSIVIEGIPYETSFKVEETSVTGWESSGTVTGTINSTAPSGNAEITNKKAVNLTNIQITKVDAANADTKLSGVEFKLEKMQGSSLTDIDSSFTPITVTTGDSGDNLGKAGFTDLSDGTYRITETRTQEGYYLLKTPIMVTIDRANGCTIDGNDCTVTDNTISLTISNRSKFAFPSTGGYGKTTFILAGVILIWIAGLIYILKKQQKC